MDHRITDRQIITGHDGSPASDAAVEWAATAARCRRAELCIVGAHRPPPITEVGYGFPVAATLSFEGAGQAIAEELDRVASGLRARHRGLEVRTEVIDDTPRHALVARADGADLLVVGASGAGSIGGWVFGSVVQHAIRHSPCPVAVVPAGWADDAARSVRRVVVGVVGVDGSAAAQGALDWAADEADLRGWPLDVVHAWERPFYGEGALTADAQAFAEVDASTTLSSSTARAAERSGAVVTGHLVEGGAVDHLLEAGKGAALLVVGSAWRGCFRTMLVGSVAQAVAEHAPCPVVVVRRGNHAVA